MTPLDLTPRVSQELPVEAVIPQLRPGNGCQIQNRTSALKFISKWLFDGPSVSVDEGTFCANGVSYRVCAYANSGAAMIDTPNDSTGTHNIWNDERTAFLCRQIGAGNLVIYELEPQRLLEGDDAMRRGKDMSASWNLIGRRASRSWVIRNGTITLWE